MPRITFFFLFSILGVQDVLFFAGRISDLYIQQDGNWRKKYLLEKIDVHKAIFFSDVQFFRIISQRWAHLLNSVARTSSKFYAKLISEEDEREWHSYSLKCKMYFPPPSQFLRLKNEEGGLHSSVSRNWNIYFPLPYSDMLTCALIYCTNW